MRFVDTKVLIYAVGADPNEAPKMHRALELLGSRDLALSVQVLQEFYVQVTRVTRRGALTHEEAVSFMTSMLRFPVQALTVEVMHLTLDIRRRFGLSYWDSAILAAARVAGCTIVLSEDLSPHQDYDGVRVVNPFL